MNRYPGVLIKNYLFRFVIILAVVCAVSQTANSQAVAGFSINDTIGCSFPNTYSVYVENTGSAGAEYSYAWYFDDSGPYSGLNYTYGGFVSAGEHLIKQIVTNTNTNDKDSLTKSVSVLPTPLANLTIIDTNACVNGYVHFRANFQTRDSAHWNFGDGTIIENVTSYIDYSYDANGTYNVQYITYYDKCSDTSAFYPITIDGPVADFDIAPDQACTGESIEFTMSPVSDVNSFTWDLGEDDIQTVNPATHVYSTQGYVGVSLRVSGASGNCTVLDTLYIYEVEADFGWPDARCDEKEFFLSNSSTGNDINHWDLGDGSTSTLESPAVTYPAGEYTVTLSIANDQGCVDTLQQQVIVNQPPDINVVNKVVVCPDETAQLEASGGSSIGWTPSDGLNDPASYTPLFTPYADTTTLTATITDLSTQCTNQDEVVVILQEGFIKGLINVSPTDTSVIIGDTVFLRVNDELERDLSYHWTPESYLNCYDCASPFAQALENITYTLSVSDTNQCFDSEEFTLAIDITEEYRLGVPAAFTPNGDGINDIIKVDGWGIKQLLEFRVFNRWGKEMFFSDDINTGWNGYLDGNLQLTGTYSYLIRAELWDDSIKELQGTFDLLR